MTDSTDDLAVAARELFQYEEAGAPDYLDWDRHFDRLKENLAKYDAARELREAERDYLVAAIGLREHMNARNVHDAPMDNFNWINKRADLEHASESTLTVLVLAHRKALEVRE